MTKDKQVDQETVLLTGASGSIGFHCVKQLIQSGPWFESVLRRHFSSTSQVTPWSLNVLINKTSGVQTFLYTRGVTYFYSRDSIYYFVKLVYFES